MIGLTNNLAIFTNAQSWVIIRGTNELEGYLGIAAVLKKTADELQNGCPERKGEIEGRLIFEVLSLIATPEVKLAELGNVARLGAAQGKLLEVMAETTATGQKVSRVLDEVPAVATIVEGRIPVLQAELDVVTSVSGKLQPAVELRGSLFGLKILPTLNWEVAGKLTYGGNNGIDMFLKGTGPNAGRWAVVECKGGASRTTLNCLKVDKQGMRQMTKEWVVNRLTRAKNAGDPNAQELLDALDSKELDFYVTLQGSGEVWKINPEIYIDGEIAANKLAGAAEKIYPKP